MICFCIPSQGESRKDVVASPVALSGRIWRRREELMVPNYHHQVLASGMFPHCADASGDLQTSATGVLGCLRLKISLGITRARLKDFKN